jgi:hypothetical protein
MYRSSQQLYFALPDCLVQTQPQTSVTSTAHGARSMPSLTRPSSFTDSRPPPQSVPIAQRKRHEKQTPMSGAHFQRSHRLPRPTAYQAAAQVTIELFAHANAKAIRMRNNRPSAENQRLACHPRTSARPHVTWQPLRSTSRPCLSTPTETGLPRGKVAVAAVQPVGTCQPPLLPRLAARVSGYQYQVPPGSAHHGNRRARRSVLGPYLETRHDHPHASPAAG